MSEYKNEIGAEREKERIETVIDWLFVPEGERRHMFLSHAERLSYYKRIVEKLAYMPHYIQERLMVHWIWLIVSKKRDKEAAQKLLERTARELYSSSQLEAWAESRLITKKLKITPVKMAIEYCMHIQNDVNQAGLYVRDMQRIKARMAARYKRTGFLEKTPAAERLQRPRYRRTSRQETKYQKRQKAKTEGGKDNDQQKEEE